MPAHMCGRFLFGLLIVAGLLLLGTHTSYSINNFEATSATQLCAYTGSQLETPCTVENLAASANADITTVLTVPAGDMNTGILSTMTPSEAAIPGSETNAECGNSADDDGDTSVNDGCPLVDPELETNMCANSLDDDPSDDAAAGPGKVNDGCPQVGATAETGAQCDDSVDSDGDTVVNDGCYPGGLGGPEAEINSWCEDAADDDPPDDAAGGAQKVNDGCPQVGATAETGAQCDDSVDSDGDTVVNDGCYPGGFGGVEAEVNECANSTDDDADGVINDGCPGVGDLPVGAVVGRLQTSDTLGLINSACANSLPVPLTLMNGTRDNAPENELASLPQGQASDEGIMEPFRDDGDGNGLPQHVDRYPSYLNRLFDPDRVGDINGDGDEFDTVSGVPENPGASATDPYGTVDPVAPHSRYSGSLIVSGEARVLQVVLFAPAALAPFSAPHPLSDLARSSLGYPAVIVLDDPTSPAGPSAITDACSPSTATVVLWGKTRDNPCLGGTCPNDDAPCHLGPCGDNVAINSFAGSTPPFNEGDDDGPCDSWDTAGCIRYANPSATGTYYWLTYHQSQRDADDDGIENSLDTCPYTATSGYDPRNVDATNDADGDGIPGGGPAGGCDPSPSIDSGAGNHDGDDLGGEPWLNRGDNCPLTVNSNQKESEQTTRFSDAVPTGGPRADGIGDACDSQPYVSDGHFHTTMSLSAKCIGETDLDADGFCDSTEGNLGSDLNSAASTPEDPSIVLDLPLTNAGSGGTISLPGQVGEPFQACNDGVDNDGDTLLDAMDGAFTWSASGIAISGCRAVDTDGDGYSRGVENWVYHSEWTSTDCGNATDDDGDGKVNDGCSQVGATVETAAQCDNNINDDPGDDSNVNDGCPPVPPTGAPAFLDPCGSEASVGWPPDLVDGVLLPNGVDIQDMTSYITPIRRLNTSPGHVDYDQRWDIAPGHAGLAEFINIVDLTVLSINEPPMLGEGVRGFGETCPYPP